jgi:hypothetical protein
MDLYIDPASPEDRVTVWPATPSIDEYTVPVVDGLAVPVVNDNIYGMLGVSPDTIMTIGDCPLA